MVCYYVSWLRSLVRVLLSGVSFTVSALSVSCTHSYCLGFVEGRRVSSSGLGLLAAFYAHGLVIPGAFMDLVGVSRGGIWELGMPATVGAGGFVVYVVRASVHLRFVRKLICIQAYNLCVCI